jgi:uncharacterized RDD family membrane protein YckC
MESDERLRIDTPEQVALELPLAGVGSRFLAVFVDTVLQVALTVAGVIAFSVAPATLSPQSFLGLLGPATAILFAFGVYWGYFAAFEALWSGRTPGKRIAGIRVIKESGRPINAYEAIARNVLRAIDFLPAMYGLGVVVMLLNRNSRRIGDYVAGTIVVHDRSTEGLRPALTPVGDVGGGTESLARVTADELMLVETYLHRRFDLDVEVREQRAEQIINRIAMKTGLRPHDGQPVDEFLESIARRVRDTARFR